LIPAITKYVAVITRGKPELITENVDTFCQSPTQ